MGMTPRQLLRDKGTPYAELNLGDPKWSDDEILDFMLEHPILINRPIVVTPRGVLLARPSEAVLDILPNPNIGPFVKEDGEVVVDNWMTAGKRPLRPSRQTREIRYPLVPVAIKWR
jgi:arsenate reductase